MNRLKNYLRERRIERYKRELEERAVARYRLLFSSAPPSVKTTLDRKE